MKLKINKGILDNTRFYLNLVKHNFYLYIIINFLVGFLDGIGLILFIPIISNFANTQHDPRANIIENSQFLNFISKLGISINLQSILLLILIIFITKGLVRYFQVYLLATIRYRIMTKLRSGLLANLNNLSFTGYINIENGILQNNFTGEITKVYNNMTNLFISFQSLIMGVTYLSLATFVNYRFAIIISLSSIVIRIALHPLIQKTEKYSQINTKKANNLNQGFIQTILNFKYLKATNTLKKYSYRINEIVISMEKLNFKMGKYQSLIEGTKEPFAVAIIILILLFQLHSNGNISQNVLVSLILLYKTIMSFNTLNASLQVYQQTTGSVKSVRSINDYLKKWQTNLMGTESLTSINKIEIKNVTIKYGINEILKEVSFTIHKNEIIAIIGESGVGKTSLINNILGLQYPTDGNIYINNIKIQDYSGGELNRKIGYTTQDNVIFNDTIFNNVTMFAPKKEPNLKKFWEAIKLASLYDFISNLKNREDTILGDNGDFISGGQKQRISIARELYKKPELLIMDEATSALDDETENILRENLKKLKGFCTIIIIAHRLNTIKDVDKIVSLKNKGIEYFGNYEGLKKQIGKT